MKNKKKFLRTSISTLVVVATFLIAVVATIKYKEDYDEEKRFNDIREILYLSLLLAEKRS